MQHYEVMMCRGGANQQVNIGMRRSWVGAPPRSPTSSRRPSGGALVPICC